MPPGPMQRLLGNPQKKCNRRSPISRRIWMGQKRRVNLQKSQHKKNVRYYERGGQSLDELGWFPSIFIERKNLNRSAFHLGNGKNGARRIDMGEKRGGKRDSESGHGSRHQSFRKKRGRKKGVTV